MNTYLFLAFNNIKRRKLRSWLTVLGIFIGIAAVVSLISLGQGLQGFINGQFAQLRADKIIIQPKSFGAPGAGSNSQLVLSEKDLRTIRDVQGVDSAEGILIGTGIIKNNEEQKVQSVSGIEEAYLELFGEVDATKIIEGRQIRDSDTSKAVVGYNHAYGNLWDKPLKMGDNIEIQGKTFKVIGVLKKQGNPIDDGAVWIQKDIYRELFNSYDDEGMIVAKTKKGADPEQVAATMKEKLRKSRGEKSGQETFNVQTSTQLLETFSNIFAVVQAVFVGIAAISLVVGGIGIMNTMYTSVLERTKEVGTMKAIGAKNSDILTLFLFESGLLGLVGGGIGVLIGMGIGKSVEYVATVQLGTPYLQAIFGWPLVMGALAFSFFIGAASGILPAMQAAKLKPAQALRYE